MSIINVSNTTNTNQYTLIISRLPEDGVDSQRRIVVSDNFLNQISVINIEQGPQGLDGPKGEKGDRGTDAIQFNILPISSGGTNNTVFDSGNIIYYDGTKLTTSSYSIQDILDEAALSANAITGIVTGSGLYRTLNGNTITIDTILGEGLEIGPNNEIIVDNTIARTAELDLGEINGQVPISKGGTNNNFFNTNKLVYFDGLKLKSFPVSTGLFLFSGISIDIIAGSGLIGGGSISIPDGSITLNIPSSADIFVDDTNITLSTTGTPGTYSKITTDSKGRVISGTSLTTADIINILGYTPFHAGNDGPGSNLDADLLDGQHGYYYTNAGNLTGTIHTSVLPSSVEPGTYTKVAVGNNGLVTDVYYANQADIIYSLGYTPVPTTGHKTIFDNTTLQGDLTINGELTIYDHLPLLATDNPQVLPDTPRGISFVYGGLFSSKTGILAYYPAANELRLVTNVFASGADIDGDGDSDYQDDINGGNAQSVFVLQNLDGDSSTVLLKHIADAIYVKTTEDENIRGLKSFLDGIQVARQIIISNPPGNTSPPLEIYNNTNKVINFNSDLLDGEHGTYYTNAGNMTGNFSYENVTFDHIQGTHQYLPVFDDTNNIPASRITNSVIRQDTNNNLIIEQNNSMSIGSGSDIHYSHNSLSVGTNTISGNNSLAVGTNNQILANNAVALHSNSKAMAPNSLSLGSYGLSYLSNQIAVGAFRTDDIETNVVLQHGQYTTLPIYLTSTTGSSNMWMSMSPSITIPHNKTIAYDLELLVSKVFGTGVAHFKFASGLFKNATFRNANNLTEIINLSTQPQLAKKNELFNNSQIKNHYLTFRHSHDLDFMQDVHIRPEIENNTLSIENNKDYYLFTKQTNYNSGIYEKTNDGTLILDFHKPILSGNDFPYSRTFSLSTTDRGIRIMCPNHEAVVGCYVDIGFPGISGNITDILDNFENGYKKVYSVIDENTFFIDRPIFSGFLSYYSGSPESNIDYVRIIINRNSIGDLLKASGNFAIASKIYVDTDDGSYFFNSGILSTGLDYNHELSLYYDTTTEKRETYPSGLEINTVPLFSYSGLVNITPKRNISGQFISSPTNFSFLSGVYIRRKTNNGLYHPLEIYTNNTTPINLPYTPLSYELTSGYKDDDNDQFDLENINDQYFLKAKYPFNYEVKNIYYIRIKAQDRLNNKFKEKYFTLTINDKRDPYKLYSIADQTVDIAETFNYTIPSNLFNEEESEGPLTYSASLQNGNTLPSWLFFDNNTLSFSGTPSGCDLGTYNIRISAENSFSKIFDDFYLTVTDNSVQIFDTELFDVLDITDIYISNTHIDENLPSGTIFASISGEGSYSPYLQFFKAENNFSGSLVQNQDIFEAFNIHYDLPLISISSDVGSIPRSGLLLNTALSNDCRVVNIYKPFILSGTPGLVDGNIYFSQGYNNNDVVFFSGLNIYTTEPKLIPNFSIDSWNDYSAFIGDRLALSTELDTLFPELINTEDDNTIVTRHSNIRDTLLGLENLYNFTIEDNLSGFIIANDALNTNINWASGYPNCNDADLIENQLVSFAFRTRDYNIEIGTSENLHNFNPPPQSGLKRSNIKYGQDIFSFRDSIINPVLALYGIGSGDLCTLLTENNNLLHDEDNNDLISNNENHHGTRIEINHSYELFDYYNVVKDNGKLLINTFDQFISENGDPIVHDYAIAARSGDVCLLFPGIRQLEEKLIYPDPIDLLDNTYNFYYNWGKLIPFSFSNDKYYVKINQPYTGNNLTTIIKHEEEAPITSNYQISGLKNYSYIIQSGNCPIDTFISGVKGFESIDYLNQEEYATGIVHIYTHAGTGIIELNFAQDINLDNRLSNNIKLYNVSSTNALLDLPIEDNYNNITILDSNSLQIQNYFYLPYSGISGFGVFEANLDINHGYVEEKPYIINRIPVKFENNITTLSGLDLNLSHRPKNYTFDILNIDGNRITVKDDKNYVLKETNRPDYFEQSIHGQYLTNGIKFSGSLFNDHQNIYDIRYHLYDTTNILDLISFSYNYTTKNFSFTCTSGSIKPYDEIIVTFPSGFSYSSGIINGLITNKNLLSLQTLKDLEPNKDSILLETSTSIDATINVDQAIITGFLPNTNFSTQGTCTINNSIINRLQSGFLLNHSGSNIFGYQIDSCIPGFTFTGIIPKNNNIISTNISDQIDANHIGHASIFGTGNNLLYSGARILYQATANDIGYREYYLIDNSDHIDPGLFGGIGTDYNPYLNVLQTSGTNKYLEFLYLGHNTNTIRLVGNYGISGGLDQLRIYYTTFDEQVTRYRASLDSLESVVFDTQIFSTGIEAGSVLSGTIDLTFNVERFAKIKVELDSLDSSFNHIYKNYFNIKTYATQDVDFKPYILSSSGTLNSVSDYYPYINSEPQSIIYTPVPTLDSNNCIDCDTKLPQYIPNADPYYSVLSKHDFHILPYIITNNKYCGSNYDKNKQIFFNGNIIEIHNLEIPRSYLLHNDELKILKFNNTNLSNSGVTHYIHKYNATEEEHNISGISIRGDKNIPPKTNFVYPILHQDVYRFNSPLGTEHNKSLNNTGVIEFIKSTSGQFNDLSLNNIYYHTYGESTAHYPLDQSGKLVPIAQTGIYTIASNTSSCASGTLCITISGYHTDSFINISDIGERNHLGKRSNVLVDSYGNKGVIRPYGSEKKFYFDFDDGAPNISNIYYIEDLLAPNILTIQTPYNSGYIGKSGLVYIIDSDQNIKSHLNPNLDNQFIVSTGFIGSVDNVPTTTFNYFDHSSKRWKHTIHLHEQPSYTGYEITIPTNKNTNLLSIGPTPISISNIQYSIDNGLTYQNIIDDYLKISTTIEEVVLKITTTDGDNSLFDTLEYSMPKVSISGLGSYYIELNEPAVFNRKVDSWDIGVKFTPPSERNYNRPINIRVADLTGEDTRVITIDQFLQPKISPIMTGYYTTGTIWSMGFDIANLDVDSSLLANQITLVLDGAPVDNANIYYTDDTSVVYTGSVGMTTGIFNPILTITDITTTPYQILDIGSGSLVILDHISNKPAFDLQLNNLQSNNYLNINDNDPITFQIPALLGPDPNEVLNNLSLTFTTNDDYRLFLYSSSYNNATQRFEIIAFPYKTGEFSYTDHTAKYNNQTVSILLKQPVYDTFGNYTYQTYSKSLGFNVTVYQNISIDLIPAYTGLNLSTDSAWSIDFYVRSGITEHDAFNRPNVRIFGAPNLSPYLSNPSEYSVDYNYDIDQQAWRVSIASKKDIFGKYIQNTGSYTLNIFAEDEYSSYDMKNINITYYHKTKLRNINSVVYGTPDNPFFTKADSFDLNENNTSQEVSIPNSLKEPSIHLNTINKLYDRDLNIFEYGYVSDPMIDKYDARLLVDNDTITVQCRGIGADKIIAVGKLNTIEIENNELQALPLKITGVSEFGSESGIVVSQGNTNWNLSFKTIGGLAHPNYPPTILLSDMPTFCSGYNPLIETQLECAAQPTWNADDFGGSWSYIFSGIPSCVLLGEFPFTITAIDTDTSLLPSNPYVASDQVDHLITYTKTIFSGLPPNITPAPNNSTIIKPLCGNLLYYNKILFGPGDAQFCLGPTGIKSFSVSGSVPSGLSYSLFFPSENNDNTPSEPYSNLGSGYLLIEGYPTAFASGSTYPEQLFLDVVDARNLTGTYNISFTDSSVAIDPDVSLTVFFDKPDIVLTPGSGLKTIIGGNYNGWRPSPTVESLICKSVLPHNKCGIMNVQYSGQVGADTRVFLIGEELDMSVGDEIYVDFLDSSNDELDGAYIAATGSNQLFYIDRGISPQPVSGNALVIIGKYIGLPTNNYDDLFKNLNIIDNTTKCILGGGIAGFSAVASPLGRGLRGAIAPSYQTSLSGLTPFASTNTRYTGLQFTRINPEIDVVSTIGWSDCWQTGYLNISGIMVPPIHAEIVDPPPAQDYEFSFNGARFALATRLVFGETETQKLLPQNERSASLSYVLTDESTGSELQSGNVSAGSSFDTVALNSNSGTIYRIKISKQRDTFPTYNAAALPGDENEYLWIHKGDNLSTTPTQSSFPPILTFGFDSISVINDLDDSDPNGIVMDPVDGIALGGYTPSIIGLSTTIPYATTGTPETMWTTEDFPPILSGIIQRPLYRPGISSISASYNNTNKLITIDTTGSINSGESFKYTIFITLYNNLIIKDSGSLIVNSSNLDINNNIIFYKDLNTTTFNGYANIEFKSLVDTIDTLSNQMVIKHNNLPYQIGDHICVDKNEYVSTELNLLETNGSITVVSGNSTYMYLQCSDINNTTWYDNFAELDLVDISINIDDNIKIMPYNTIYSREGRYNFQITGRSNILENEDLTYKICTSENSNMPIFDSSSYPSVNMYPKRHFINYPLYINKPIKIDTLTVVKQGNLLTFSLIGGKRPIYNNTPDIQLAAGINDFGYCGFFRHSVAEELKDEYDAINDRLNIKLTISNDYGIDWTNHTSLRIKVSDETGSDEYTYEF